jgi:hypothetical protein
MTGYRLFFPFREPTLIRIKKKEAIFWEALSHSGRSTSLRLPKLNDDESDFTACSEAARAGTRRWYSWFNQRARQKDFPCTAS